MTSNRKHQHEILPSMGYPADQGQSTIIHNDREYTKKEAIEDLRQLAESFPERRITRDFYRQHANIPEKVWTGFFGTFPEYLRQAGLQYTRIENRVRLRIGQHASVDALREISEERLQYGEGYIRTNKKRYQSMVACADLHDIECDPFYLRVLLGTIRSVRPEIVCIAGDLFDIPEFGRYTVDPREWDTVGRIQAGLDIVRQIREAAPDAQIDLLEGNHECVSVDTEVLTDKGWVRADRVTEDLDIGSFGDWTLSFSRPVKVSRVDQAPLVEVKGDLSDELVSMSHRIYVDGRLVPVEQFLGSKIRQTRMTYAQVGVQSPDACNEESCDMLRLLVWTVMDGTIVSRQIRNCRIQFKLSKERKIKRLCHLLTRMGIPFTLRPAGKSGANSVPAHVIRIYGDSARRIYDLLGGLKEIPSDWVCLSVPEASAIAEEIGYAGHVHYNHIVWTTTSKKNADVIQEMCIRSGIPCKITCKITERGKSGFSDSGRRQYKVAIFDRGISDRRYVHVREAGMGPVIAIATPNGTLVTRRHGKVSFTGNSRVIRHVSESSPALREILSDLHGFTVAKLLKLDEYEVNYVAKGDLFAFTDHQMKKETLKNYKVYWNCMMAHHFPAGRNYGLPGFHGHHHQHIVWTMHGSKMGSYEWHQLGGGHVRDASYTDGSQWNNGFVIANCDTQHESVIFDYTYVGDTFSVSGGTFFYRQEDEYYQALTDELEHRKVGS